MDETNGANASVEHAIAEARGVFERMTAQVCMAEQMAAFNNAIHVLLSGVELAAESEPTNTEAKTRIFDYLNAVYGRGLVRVAFTTGKTCGVVWASLAEERAGKPTRMAVCDTWSAVLESVARQVVPTIDESETRLLVLETLQDFYGPRNVFVNLRRNTPCVGWTVRDHSAPVESWPDVREDITGESWSDVLKLVREQLESEV